MNPETAEFQPSITAALRCNPAFLTQFHSRAVSHIGSNRGSEADCALEVLLALAISSRSLLLPFKLFVKSMYCLRHPFAIRTPD